MTIDLIKELLDLLKTIPSVKNHYIFTSKQERFLIAKEYDIYNDSNRVSYSAFEDTYNRFIELYITSEFLWKIDVKEIYRERIHEILSELDLESINNILYDKLEQGTLLVVTLHDVMLLAMLGFENGEDISDLETENSELDSDNIEQYKRFYRGLSDYDYGLSATMLRDITLPKSGLRVDCKYIIKAYDDAHLAQRYEARIGSTRHLYKYCAFMQHARSYSPLIDFTEDKNIAISFACSAISDMNHYNKCDAAILEIQMDNSDVVQDEILSDRLINDFDVFICSGKKLTYKSMVRGKPLFLCTIDDFDFNIKMIDNKTNDRMKYQKGCFMLINKAVVLDGDYLVSYGNPVRIIKHRVEKSSKVDLYKHICENMHWIDQDHLMNPYKYFEEAPIEW